LKFARCARVHVAWDLTVQLCTGVMLHGVKMVDELKEGLKSS
jgi:hypothetical protein